MFFFAIYFYLLFKILHIYFMYYTYVSLRCTLKEEEEKTVSFAMNDLKHLFSPVIGSFCDFSIGTIGSFFFFIRVRPFI